MPNLPQDWTKRRFGDVASFRNGVNYSIDPSGEEVKILGVAHFLDQEVISDFHQILPIRVDRNLSEDDWLISGDLLFVRSNGNKALIGRCMLVLPGREKVTFSGFTIRARIDQSQVDPYYMASLTRSQAFRERLHTLGGGSSISNLNQELLAGFEFWLPPLGEQRRIGRILRTWDEGIQAITRMLQAKTRFAGAVSSSLLRGRLRLSGHAHPWRNTVIADATIQLSTRNGATYGEDRVMAVTKVSGLTPMRDHVRSDDISRYKVVPPNAFAYNPMRINVGSIAKNESSQNVLVSPDYVVFAAEPETLDYRYLDHLRRSTMWSQFMENAGNGSVRVRIYYADLAEMKISLPPLEEQRAIADVLDAAQLEIDLLTKKKEALERQKRGLMQKLLTGQIRTLP